MTDLEIVRAYMAKRYPTMAYAMRMGNRCIWVSMGLIEMYFTVSDGDIVDIQVD